MTSPALGSANLVNRYTHAVWLRNYLTWKRLFWSSLASNVANPLLFLFAFGFGLGRVIENIDGIPYLAFVMPGIMAYSTMFSASFEATISAFARFNIQKTWDAMLATPLVLAELLMGELLWSATKAMLAGCSVLIVGWFAGGILDPVGALLAIPVLFLASLGFAAYGLVATAYARGWEMFSYFFTFWVTPMFVFSGTFFDIDRFPLVIEWLVWLLPMTHLLAVVRPLTTGAEIGLLSLVLHIGYQLALTVLAFVIAHRELSRRMFD